MTALRNLAIQTALLGEWSTAIDLNKQLLKINPNDIETLNRIAFAYLALGKIKEAKQEYQKVLQLDNENPIALRNLKRFKTEFSKRSSNDQSQRQSVVGQQGNIFIEETGKTKVIELINIAEPKTISTLRPGESLILWIKRLKVFVLDTQKKYIGMLPDNIGKRLIKFIYGGSAYEVYIKSLEEHRVVIFVRETKRSQRFKNQPSFFSSHDKTHLIGDKYIKKTLKARRGSQDYERSSESDPEEDSL